MELGIDMKKLLASLLALVLFPGICPAPWIINPYTTNTPTVADAHVLDLVINATAITTSTFASTSNALTLNNGRWLLQTSTNGAVTSIVTVSPYTWATLVVSNSSGTTNTFSITAPARAYGPATTNVMSIPNGKMAYVSFDCLPGAWTNYCTAIQQ